MDPKTSLNYFATRFNIDLSQPKMPIEILPINRTLMAQCLHELGVKEGAEIGVAQGTHSKILCEQIPGLHLYAIDVWDEYDGYPEYQGRISRYYEQAKRSLGKFYVDFLKAFSMDAVKGFEDNSLDFVYIDGAHDFLHAAEDICTWSPKVKPGGIVFGHDYKWRWTRYVCDVKYVVMSYTYCKNIKPWFVLGSASTHPGDFYKGDGGQAWMYVRQPTDRVHDYNPNPTQG